MIRVPRRMAKSNLLAYLRVADALVHSADQTITVDASKLRFIDQFGLTLLAGGSLRARGAGRAHG